MELKWNPFTKCSKEDLAAGKAKDPDIYIDKDGLARCKFCHEPRMWYYEEYETWLGTACSCVKKRDEEEKRKAEINKNISSSGIYGKMLKADLNKMTVQSGNMAAFNSCAKYVGVFADCVKHGWGIYLYGASGCGKTYLACAVGNALLQQGVVVKYASVLDISSDIHASYYNRTGEDERSIISKYTNAEFLIMDDIGVVACIKATKYSSFMLDKIHYILNKRNLYELPTFFVSEYSIDELVTKGRYLQKTVFLINEMSNRKIEMKRSIGA